MNSRFFLTPGRLCLSCFSVLRPASCHLVPRTGFSLFTKSNLTSNYHSSPSRSCSMELKAVVKVLEQVAPSSHAESWDNVGLLVEPSPSQHISRLVITNDLTEEVLDEIVKHCSPLDQCLVISYHPPIFRPLKRLTQTSATHRVLLRAVGAGMAVYSPHTALDNAPDGMADWLLSGLGEGVVMALGVNKHPALFTHRVEVKGLLEKDREGLLKVLEPCSGVGDVTQSDIGLVVSCTERALGPVLSLIGNEYPTHNVLITAASEMAPTLSGGKLLTLKEPSSLSEITGRVKAHLGLPFLRLAKPQFQDEDSSVQSVAVCPGSGGSVLEGVKADVILTGEMSYHQVLAATSRGVAVVLCEHSNTERGFLQNKYKKKLEKAFENSLDIFIPKSDKDPLQIV